MNSSLEDKFLSVRKGEAKIPTHFIVQDTINQKVIARPQPPTLLVCRHPTRDTRTKRKSCSLSKLLAEILYKCSSKRLDSVLSLRWNKQIRVSENKQVLQLYHKRFVDCSNKERILPRIYSYILRGVLNSQPLYGTNKYTLTQT